MKKRFLSLLLVICLVVGLTPMTAFADGTGRGTVTKAFVKAVFSETVGTAGSDSQICAATVKDKRGDFELHYVYSSDSIWNVQLFNRVRDGLAEPYKSLIPILENDDNNKKGFLFLSDDQYKDMALDWSDPDAVAKALIPGSGTVTTKENTSSVFSGTSTDIIEEYCSDYNEKVVEFINAIGESVTPPTGTNIIEVIDSVAKGGPYYIVEDGITKECNDVVIFLHVSRISVYTAAKEGQEATPQAVFTAADDSSGSLSKVDASMKYSTDGGASWTDITGTTAAVTGVTADKDIQVVKKGDGTATVDSDAQIIDVTQAAQPAGIGKTDCTTAAQNDGTITGVDSTMEYRLSSASEWTSISGNTVSGLANGTYDIRVKANGTVLASEVATVTIGAHTCAAQGDWQHDANEHWKLCACGAEVDRAAHAGGTATCTEKAVCDICGEEYGEVNVSNHTNLVKTEDKAPNCTEDGNIEYWYCENCGKYFSDENATAEITLAETVVPATGHGETELKNQKDATCIEEGYTGDKVCAVCGEILEKGETIPKLAHDYKDGKCTVCGAADPNYKPTESGNGNSDSTATGETTSPETGDSSNMALWIELLFVSGGMLTAITYRKKKQVRK